MKLIKIGMLILLLSGCTTVEQRSRVPNNLHAKEFNSIASQYLDRPTFTSIEKMSDGETVLAISMDNYGNSSRPIRFLKSNVSNYVSLIDKYTEWEHLAKARGDAITKEIGRAKTWGNGLSGTLKFIFHSGNATNHFLAVSFCAAGTCLDDQSLYFDATDAQELKKMLLNLESGEIQVENIDDLYR